MNESPLARYIHKITPVSSPYVCMYVYTLHSQHIPNFLSSYITTPLINDIDQLRTLNPGTQISLPLIDQASPQTNHAPSTKHLARQSRTTKLKHCFGRFEPL